MIYPLFCSTCILQQQPSVLYSREYVDHTKTLREISFLAKKWVIPAKEKCTAHLRMFFIYAPDEVVDHAFYMSDTVAVHLDLIVRVLSGSRSILRTLRLWFEPSSHGNN